MESWITVSKRRRCHTDGVAPSAELAKVRTGTGKSISVLPAGRSGRVTGAMESWITVSKRRRCDADEVTPSADLIAKVITDTGTGITVPVARSARGPVWDLEGEGGGDENGTASADMHCYECGSKLYYRAAHKRSRCGVTFHVGSHFSHYPSHTACTGETYLHAAAKHAIVVHATRLRFFHTCTGCRAETVVTVHESQDELLLPTEEAVVDDYRADVGFLSTSGEVVGVIEVLVTHEMGQAKRQRLTEMGIAWC
jgi:hypothetical protein